MACLKDTFDIQLAKRPFASPEAQIWEESTLHPLRPALHHYSGIREVIADLSVLVKVAHGEASRNVHTGTWNKSIRKINKPNFSLVTIPLMLLNL